MMNRLNATDASSAVRHQWLEAAVAELRSRFTGVGYTVPDAVRVSIGWTKYTPYKHAIGQCWALEQYRTPMLRFSSRRN
jgi:hypothetical protein